MLTDFEKQVLEAVKKIPRGKIVSYSQIAKMIGKPKAARAVGQALKKNPSLVTIPCHRVVKSSGEVGGYVLGQKQKIELLRQERVKIVNGRIKNFDMAL